MERRIVACVIMLCVAVRAGWAAELPRADPAAVGMSAEKIKKLAPALQKLVDEGKIPGAVALVARHGKVVKIATLGYQDIENKKPMTEETIFALASMTKPITCVAVMMLVEQGRLGLDDAVGKYLSELDGLLVLGDARQDTATKVATVAAKRPVTIRHLLTHTSGISYGVLGSTDERLKREYLREKVVGPRHATTAVLVARLGKVPLAHQPGEAWTYGFSHDVLARVVEVVSGQTFDRYLEKTLFTPLNMHDTSFLVPKVKRERVAVIYDAGEGGRLKPLPREFGSATYFGGGYGLFSTARDYARFAQMLLNGGTLDSLRVLKATTVAAMTSNQIGELESFPGRKYGFGFGLAYNAANGQPVLERYYGGGAYSTDFWVIPRRELILVLMTQVVPTGHGNGGVVLHGIVNAAIGR